MSDKTASPNAAFNASLEKVVDAERVVLATAIARLRILCALLAMAVLVAQYRTYPLSTFFAAAYLTLSIVLWRLLKTGRLVKSAGFVVPLFDVPIVAIGQLLQTSSLPVPWMGMVNSPPMMLAFVVLAAFSLSRMVVLLTAMVGLVPILYRSWYISLSPGALGLTLMAYVGISGALMALVTRIRTLVHSARAQDLLGKYVLGRRIGLGGMAEVFEATYSPEGGFERRVAVKRILPSFAGQAETLAMFRQEAKVGAQLAHPCVVQVLDFGTHQGTSFMAMEYIDGVSLKDLLVHYRLRNELLPIGAVTHIAWQITEALDYIHTRVSNTGQTLNLVHRDLNPPNIMLTSIGDAKLADFGIALISGQERVTAAGVMRGKLIYAAPEQVTGGAYDGRADLFALGLTLHECLTGTRVFNAKNDFEAMKMSLESVISPPSVTRPDVPPALDHVVMKLLERDLTARTQSASDLRRQLLELPRELLDVQTGRRLLGFGVTRAKEEKPEMPNAPEVATSPEVTRTRTIDPI